MRKNILRIALHLILFVFFILSIYVKSVAAQTCSGQLGISAKVEVCTKVGSTSITANTICDPATNPQTGPPSCLCRQECPAGPYKLTSCSSRTTRATCDLRVGSLCYSGSCTWNQPSSPPSGGGSSGGTGASTTNTTDPKSTLECSGGIRCDGSAVTGTEGQVECGQGGVEYKCTAGQWVGTGSNCTQGCNVPCPDGVLCDNSVYTGSGGELVCGQRDSSGNAHQFRCSAGQWVDTGVTCNDQCPTANVPAPLPPSNPGVSIGTPETPANVCAQNITLCTGEGLVNAADGQVYCCVDTNQYKCTGGAWVKTGLTCTGCTVNTAPSGLCTNSITTCDGQLLNSGAEGQVLCAMDTRQYKCTNGSWTATGVTCNGCETTTATPGGSTTCGNGTIETGEVCDAGKSNGECPNAWCSTSCTKCSNDPSAPVFCSNGIACGNIFTSGWVGTSFCDISGAIQKCGENGDYQPTGETCTCSIPATDSGAGSGCPTISRCDGVNTEGMEGSVLCGLQGVEYQCTNGTWRTTGNDCSASCRAGTNPFCGNGLVETGEVCDRGQENGPCPSGCSTSCTANPGCSTTETATDGQGGGDQTDTSPQQEAAPYVECDVRVQAAIPGMTTATASNPVLSRLILDGPTKVDTVLKLTSEGFGTFGGEITKRLRSGDYAFYLKVPKHLGVMETNVNISSPIVDVDFSDTPMPAGDVNPQDGIIDSYDLFTIRSLFGKTDTRSLTVADLNNDGIVDVKDFELAEKSMNYKFDQFLLFQQFRGSQQGTLHDQF